MIALHLTDGFNPAPHLPHVTLQKFIFPGGEPHLTINEVQKLKSTKDIFISSRLNSWTDIGVLALACDAVRRVNNCDITLFLPYFPGARQDRVANHGEALTVKVYADVINSLNAKKVIIFEPHSDVAPALINNVHVFSSHHYIQAALDALKTEAVLISPDAGAEKRSNKHFKNHKFLDLVYCYKQRNTKTGELTGFSVRAENLEKRPCVIIDDICDGGGTFIGLAQELKNRGAGSVTLVVAHGIFSKNKGNDLFGSVDRIITTDSIHSASFNEKITFINFSQFLNPQTLEM